ncbi:metalloregulator ArsR/SmtB family transcription factor [Psychrosphaera saromensis]|uniref:ArsR family transcriptional regulator n=1 Tax=Psychrosphaera saromensis TaxID=716813 RepID=A0A2S7UZ15_9GAMM|nr:metalloregulator ArsR/SmtB family transcription factor [Psychrosphaera saromensis]PQJ54978.1 ArsR family transcriptional regulator [Psychrosphaera saromensis]
MANLNHKQSVLFLCTGNSARSQMAEALLRHKAGEQFDVYSAGTQPEQIDSRTLSALKKFGLDTASLISNHVDDFTNRTFDYVITLCDKANKECRSYKGAQKQLAWDFPDPKNRDGLDPFASTLNEINNRLSMFLLVESKFLAVEENKTANHTQSNPLQNSNSQIQQTLNIDPISFFKCLTDDIRLKVLLLTNYYGELCVCELMEGLTQDSQPKVSRNLAVLKKANILLDRKHSQWVFYQINPALPLWVKNTISQTSESNIELVTDAIDRISNMKNRPNKDSFCK